MNPVSGSQLDKLGDRLRAGPLSLADLQQLRTFLDTLEPFAEQTYAAIRDADTGATNLLPAQITRRNVKTIRSIIAKLRRQPTLTLRQVQDLVGCRIVVSDVIDQNEWLSAVASIFEDAQIVDRRATPQHGYRAVHLIVRNGIRRFEVQLRTLLQDRWANIVEKLADRRGLEVKYGGGPPETQSFLVDISKAIERVEELEGRWQVRLQQGLDDFTIRLYALMTIEHGKGPLRVEERRPVWEARFGLHLFSERRISEESRLLIGPRDGSHIARATVKNEVELPYTSMQPGESDDLPQFMHRAQYTYALEFEDGADEQERFRDEWEQKMDLSSFIDDMMTRVESDNL